MGVPLAQAAMSSSSLGWGRGVALGGGSGVGSSVVVGLGDNVGMSVGVAAVVGIGVDVTRAVGATVGAKIVAAGEGVFAAPQPDKANTRASKRLPRATRR
jgi:hypothetical protein